MDGGDLPTYLVKVPGGLTWPQVEALNAQGYIALSRDVVAHPPARADVPYERNVPHDGPLSAETLFTILIVILVIGLALLEVCLLAGAAFAVGVRRQTRTVGLLLAAGGDSRTVRRSVLGQGLVLGLTAFVVGVPLAVALGVGGLALLQRVSPDVYGPFDLRPLELIAIGVIAIVAGLLAAAIPARTASRVDPVRALSGRRGQAGTPRRWPLIGIAMAVLGGADQRRSVPSASSRCTATRLRAASTSLAQPGCSCWALRSCRSASSSPPRPSWGRQVGWPVGSRWHPASRCVTPRGTAVGPRRPSEPCSLRWR